ncbi:MAG: FxDxF family PEP-CTERM protein, partial [Pseudomonadota bacterium]
FLDKDGNIIFTSSDYFQSTTTSFNQSFASSLTVSAVVLTSGKFYDNLTVAAVPEPETYAMLLAGLGLLGFMSRSRKNEQV